MPDLKPTTPGAGLIAGVLLGVVALLLVALYRMDGSKGNVAVAECVAAAAAAERVAPLARGEVAALTAAKTPMAAPAMSFTGPDGKPRTLAEFKGRAVLLNLWATWCLPCRKEMPALDQLEAQLGGPDFEVVAVNIDTTRLQNRQAFLADAGVRRLAFYADPSAEIFQVLKAAGKVVGLPTTLLIDKSGCVIGVLAGPAQWASHDAVVLVSAMIGR